MIEREATKMKRHRTAAREYKRMKHTSAYLYVFASCVFIETLALVIHV
jgi:hypothetical protein